METQDSLRELESLHEYMYIWVMVSASGFVNNTVQPSKFIFFLSGHLATDCSSLVTSEKF